MITQIQQVEYGPANFPEEALFLLPSENKKPDPIWAGLPF